MIVTLRILDIFSQQDSILYARIPRVIELTVARLLESDIGRANLVARNSTIYG